MKKRLYNRINKEVLKEQLQKSTEPRTTLSFYQYAKISDPKAFRDQLFLAWQELGVFGRAYVATEGIKS